MTPEAPVGVFDSGLGGLTVAKEIRALLPSESLLYLADTCHVPYGPRPINEIRTFALRIMAHLVESGAKAVVAACNMSSAVAIEDARNTLPVPVIGVIEAGARAALEVHRGGPIGVMATQGTVTTEAYPRHLHALAPDLSVHQVACHDFVPLVEAGLEGSPEARAACQRYLHPLISAGCRTVILGCTHYPFLLPILRAEASGLVFVDPAAATARQLRDELAARGLLRRRGRPSDCFLATADPQRLTKGVRRFMGLVTEARLSHLWDDSLADGTTRPS